MALRATPTIAICLTAGVAAGVALARPADQAPPAATQPAAQAPAPSEEAAEPDNNSPYLADNPPPAAEGAEAAPPAADPAPVAISIEGFDFSATAAVVAGSPIAVTNLDSAPHTLTAVNGEFDTGTLNQNQLGSLAAPTAPGTYAFFCEIHPSMTGELVVS